MNPLAHHTIIRLALFLGTVLLISACTNPPPSRVVYSPSSAKQVLGEYEFWEPSSAEADEALAAVDQSIASDKRYIRRSTSCYAIAIVGRIDNGKRMIHIIGESDWEKSGPPNPAIIRTGDAPTLLQAVYDQQTHAVVSLRAPVRTQ